jgi:serine/threonine protein kinase
VGIDAGQQLLHYRLIEKIGEGGMGVVWKAVDTTLDREVAIKILPLDFAADPDRLARFEREAKLLASLNDPHIASIHGLHEADTPAGLVRFLAMELIAGESLDVRIARVGAMDHDEVRHTAMQIAVALEAAHGQGVVHRDLKPANIQIGSDGLAKVLDFGLAKSVPQGGSSNPSMVTMTSAGTVAGVMLGTAGYMSPEQARGKPVDRRTDLWAFGCVLFEMLTGEKLFVGETLSDSIARILEREPDIDRLRQTVPHSIRELLHRCLAKDRNKRLRDAGDAWLVLENWEPGATEPAEVETSHRPRRLWPLAAVAIGGLLVGALLIQGLRPEPLAAPLRKFQIQIDGLALSWGESVFPSPDGRYIAYVQNSRLMIRDLERLQAREVEQLEASEASSVFWSPDSRQVGYGRESRLWKWPLEGGTPESICTLPETGEILSAAWSTDGRIVFSVWRGGMYTVSAAGGTPELLLAVDHEKIIDFHRVELLPDGTPIFDVHPAENEDSLGGIHILEGSTLRQLLPDHRLPAYSPSGHLLYSEFIGGDRRIMAVPFTASSREITGEPFRVAGDGWGARVFGDGDLTYVRSEGEQSFQLTWVDLRGDVVGSVGESSNGLEDPAISPDQNKIAVSFEADDHYDIWLVDTKDGVAHRLTFFDESEGVWLEEQMPAWSADGKDVVFTRTSSGLIPVSYAVSADGSGDERELFSGQDLQFSKDGRHVVFHTHDLALDDDLWVADIPAGGRIDDAELRVLIEGSERQREGRLSPSGDVLAYELRNGEQGDIYLARFPGGEGRWQVSTGGGRDARWNHDGSRLYFIGEDGALYEVEVQTSPSIEVGRPKRLFAAGTNDINLGLGYDVAADGRLLVVRTVSDDRKRYVVIVENWLREFEGR